MARELKTVGVVGLGTMGAGIAEVFARHGLSVVGVERDEEAVERGRGHIQHSTDRAVKRGKLSVEDQQALFDRVTFATQIEALADCDLVIEAVIERLELKREIFAELDKVVRDDAILATNTSSLSVTEISVATQRPRRVVGMHFFNPAPVQEFVEVIKTVVTEPDVVEDVLALARRLDKVPVVAADRAGFIANALLFGYLNHAVSMVESRYATREDVDAAMRLGCGYPMGPLALLDLIGLDTAYEILDTMYKQGRNRLHAPAPILKQMVTAGLLGRKTGRGFYTYESPDSPVVVDDDLTPSPRVRRPRSARSSRSVWSAPARWPSASSRSAPRPGTTFSMWPAAPRRSTGSARPWNARWRRVFSAASCPRRSATRRCAGSPVRPSSTTLPPADLVIEAVVEELSVKQALFETFDEICKPGAILATTTSSLPVIDLAMATKRPADVVGLHFFNPAPVMKLVEVVSTVSTAPEVADSVAALAVAAGKHPVRCGDRAGFIVNALLFPYLNDSVRMLEAHYAGVDDIDAAMKLGCRLPMGPFELLDVVGLDVSLAIQRTLYLEFREPGFAPAPLLEHLVTAGYLGRKTCRGFRDYTN